MAPRGSNDSLDFEVNVDGRQGNRQLDDIFSRIRKLGAEAVVTGGKLDKMPEGGIKGLRQLATELERTDRLQQAMERSRAATQAQTARTRGAQATSAATSATAGRIATNAVDLGAERIATEQVRQRNLLREQENKNLRTQSDLLINAARVEDMRAASAARAAREQERAQQNQLRTQNALQQNERSRAIQSERNARAMASGVTNERTSSLRAERSANPLGDASQIAATRYALYDVAQTAVVVGTAVASAGTASIVMASQFEQSFANVERTAGGTKEQIGLVREELVDLSTSMPTSFEDISKIATLGAQMGIARGELDGFSETVAKFSATTNVSVDTAAQSFGRISNLLDVPSEDFDKLGSSIYQVGIDSVATESEILSTTQQIAGAAATYGFTADQVVGLGAAFASLAIAPEAARGSVTRIFGDIEVAVSEGGDALAEYARIMNTDVASASRLWESDPSQFFTQLIGGLSQSNDLLKDLDSIGAKDVRDINLLQRLVGNPQLLNDSLAIANESYREGTALSAGYEITVGTLISKLQILINNFKALAAEAGGPLLAPLGAVVELLTQLVAAAADNKALLGVVVFLSLLVGGFILLKGAQAAAIAGLLALKFVMDQLGASTGLTSISFASLATVMRSVAAQSGITTASMVAATTTTNGLKTAALGLARAFAPLLIISAALGAATFINSAAHDAFDSNADKAAKYTGSMEGLTEAMVDDTKAAEEGAGSIRTFNAVADESATSTDEASSSAKNLATVLGTELVESGDASAAAAGRSALAWGDAATAYVKSQLQQSDAFKDSFATSDAFTDYFVKIGADTNKAIEIAAVEGKDGVRRYFDELEAAARERGETFSNDAHFDIMGEGFATGDVAAGVDSYIDSLGGLSEEAQRATNANAVLGSEASDTGLALEDVGAGASDAAVEVSSLSDELDALFGATDAASAFADSIQTLFSGIYDGGTSFNFLDEAGRTNLDNLRAAMEDTINYGATVGLSAAESIQTLFAELEAQGVDTASLIQQLSLQDYVFTADMDISPALSKLDALNKATGVYQFGKGPLKSAAVPETKSAFSSSKKPTTELSAAMKGLQTNLGGVARSAPRAASGTKKAGNAAKDAAKQVVTLSDYVSDLKKVFDDATLYRFGMQDALDEVADKWTDIADKIAKNREEQEEARKSIRDYTDDISKLRAEIDELTAGINQKKYFLDIAVRYGDSLRGDEISAEIGSDEADIAAKNSEIADKSGELAAAQTTAQRATDLSTLSFTEQRKSLSDLYKGYQDIILEYARSGATQEQVAQKTNELRGEFERQAAQAGFSTMEIQRYARGFDDLTYAIKNVPRNITVAADTNPAKRALDEFLAQVRNSSASPNIGSGNAGAAGAAAGALFGEEFKKASKRQMAYQVEMSLPPGSPAKSWIGGLTMYSKGGFIPGVNGFPIGGFVPGSVPADRSQDNMLGMLPNGRPIGLQGGEPIMTNAARSFYGDDMFEQINSMKFKPQVTMPTVVVQGGGSDGPMYLSSQDRLLLEQIRDSIGLTITGNALQKAVGAANRTGSIRKDS